MRLFEKPTEKEIQAHERRKKFIESWPEWMRNAALSRPIEMDLSKEALQKVIDAYNNTEY